MISFNATILEAHTKKDQYSKLSSVPAKTSFLTSWPSNRVKLPVARTIKPSNKLFQLQLNSKLKMCTFFKAIIWGIRKKMKPIRLLNVFLFGFFVIYICRKNNGFSSNLFFCCQMNNKFFKWTMLSAYSPCQTKWHETYSGSADHGVYEMLGLLCCLSFD